MKFLVVFFLLIQNYLFACGVCATDVPQVLVDTKITASKDKTSFNIKWKFHKEFVDSLTQYDLNENKIYEDYEKLLIKESLTDYLSKFRYLTDIEYKHQNKLTKTKYIQDITPIIAELIFTKNGMYFHYTFELPFVLKNNHKLYIGFEDMGGNFSFTLQSITLDNYSYAYTLNKTLINAMIELNDPTLITKKINIPKEKELVELKPQNKLVSKEEQNTQTFLETLQENMATIKENLKLLLKDIQENNSISSYIWLLFFSFLYGVVHAIGPGHGKSLVGSYFLHQNNSYFKAFSVASLIGIVHTFSAFILTFIIYYSVSFIVNSTLTNIEQISQKISAVIIIAIALYLLFKKIRTSKNTLTFTTSQKHSYLQPHKIKHTQKMSCGCNSCKTTSTDIGVILAAGIIPCPGTVTIFLFTISLGIYFVGFLSALFMSIGMSLIIFITAIISVHLRKSAKQNTLLLKTFEYLSLAIILGLGLVLLFL